MALGPDLAAALRGKNTLPTPAVNAIVPEVRTMMRFVSVPKDRVEAAVKERPGAFAAIVTWQYAATDDRALVELLRRFEPHLARTDRAGITYLGTYRKFISEIDSTPHFVTQWGLMSLAQLGEIGVFNDPELRAGYDRLVALIDHQNLAQTIHTLAVVSHD